MSTQEEQTGNLSAITDEHVAEYLLNNTNFFQHNPRVLSELELNHDSGQAVSLLERQVAVLREQNQQTNQQLHELIEIARQNEELAKRMHQLSLTLMDAEDPVDIFNTLYNSLKKNFHADKVSVRLFANPAFLDVDPTVEFAGADCSDSSLFKSIIDERVPLVGRMKEQQRVFMFGDEGDGIASSVIVPLHGKNWGGVIAIGSFDAERFQPGMGVELLANLGEILSFILNPWIAE